MKHVNLEPAPKHGPRMTVRFRNTTEANTIRRAARRAGMTRNTWMLSALLHQARNLEAGRQLKG